MRADELHYELPAGLVARYPTPRRDDARLLVVEPEQEHHLRVAELADALPAGALLVLNDSRVIPARLRGCRSATGGAVELLLVDRLQRPEPVRAAAAPSAAEPWRAMVRPARRLRPGTVVEIGTRLRARIDGRSDEPGLFAVSLWDCEGGPVEPLVEREGHMPLPPYLRRDEEPIDRERYQTIYARVPGAVAAPTAGLHFTAELMESLRGRGFRFESVTLHVGPGTFRPVAVADLDDHPMHPERFVVSPQAVAAVAQARARARPVVAVGTTVVRALESAADPQRLGEICAGAWETRLLIQPGYRFRVVDGLLTNFHLPGSTLLALVYAFGGTERVRAAYRAAIAERYRFYSYGDAMLLPRTVAPARP